MPLFADYIDYVLRSNVIRYFVCLMKPGWLSVSLEGCYVLQQGGFGLINCQKTACKKR